METRTGAFGICASRLQLDAVVERLVSEGHASRRMLVIMPETSSAGGMTRMRNSSSTCHAQMEGMFTWVMKFGAMVIGGVGLFLAGTRFSHALLGTDTQASSNLEVLLRLRLPPDLATRCDERIKRGGLFLFVDCEGSAAVPRACAVLEHGQAEHISAVGASCNQDALEENEMAVGDAG